MENPHSKGLLISRSKKFFFLKIKPRTLKIRDKAKQIKLIKININIKKLLKYRFKNLTWKDLKPNNCLDFYL